VNSFDLYQANAFAGCAPIHERLFLMPGHAGALEIKGGGNASHNREFLRDNRKFKSSEPLRYEYQQQANC